MLCPHAFQSLKSINSSGFSPTTTSHGPTMSNLSLRPPHIAVISSGGCLQPSEVHKVCGTFIVPKLTYASPALSSSLTRTHMDRPERVQKRACRIMLGPSYISYKETLNNWDSSNLNTNTVPRCVGLEKSFSQTHAITTSSHHSPLPSPTERDNKAQ